jgi:CheY-like chemotaxis protein
VIPRGGYAALTVTDTGAGIPAEHLPHVFEPLYTTKPSGKGTGLGLATVYGIVKQNHGFVWAYSEAGRGTVFKIYPPCVEEQPITMGIPHHGVEAVTRGTETVLLVEDEEALRRAAAEFLRLRGYNVLEARDGVDALSVSGSHGSTIHLALTDVVMPHMSGGQLAKELEALRPETRVLFVSGYAGQTVVDHKVVDVENNFLEKPFTLKQLAGKVRRTVLDHNPVTLPAWRFGAPLPADLSCTPIRALDPGCTVVAVLCPGCHIPHKLTSALSHIRRSQRQPLTARSRWFRLIERLKAGGGVWS